MTEILAVLALMALRIGVPVVVIMVLSWLAYRWLGEEKTTQPAATAEQRASLGGPAPMAQVFYASTHCWDVKHCSEEGKAKCPAFQRPELPCWLAIQMKTGHLREGCFDCQFYEERPSASA